MAPLLDQYASLNLMPQAADAAAKHWVPPLLIQRVTSEEKGHQVGMEQVAHCIEQCHLQDKLVISVADSAYAHEAGRVLLSAHSNWVHLCRLNSTRNIYSLPTKSLPGVGNKRRYGKKMTLNKPESHDAPDEIREIEHLTPQGKVRQMRIKIWTQKVFRGSRDYKAYEHPMTVYQVELLKDCKPVYKNPLWLGIFGQRRDEITLDEVLSYYLRRYDIEHFFRFSKRNLLMASYQTPDTLVEEGFVQLTGLAYDQLYLARTDVKRLAKPWERYLPDYQTPVTEADCATSTQTQRHFQSVLETIGTPACKPIPRGNPQGRGKGALQKTRERHPYIFKGKNKSQNKASPIISAPDKAAVLPEPQKIQLALDDIKNILKKHEVDAKSIVKLLENSS